MAQHRAQGTAARTPRTGQHRAARQPIITTGRILRWSVLPVLAGLLVLAYWHGSQVQAQQAVPRWTDGVAVCMAEDGSTPGQSFPCRWDAAYQGNGTGESFTLQATDLPTMEGADSGL